MFLSYFDESKHDPKKSPYFFLGGLTFKDQVAVQFENSLAQIQYNFFGTASLSKQNEFHGNEIFGGRGNCKGRKIADRISLFSDLLNCVQNNSVVLRFVRVNVPVHKSQYAYPTPEYRLALMLYLERVCEFLDTHNDFGLVFGDYEQNEISRSILDFSQFKTQHSTPMYYGRSIDRLVDTIYFPHSHFSRFLQVSDVLLYLCQRYESGLNHTSYSDSQIEPMWIALKNNVDCKIQTWL